MCIYIYKSITTDIWSRTKNVKTQIHRTSPYCPTRFNLLQTFKEDMFHKSPRNEHLDDLKRIEPPSFEFVTPCSMMIAPFQASSECLPRQTHFGA